jgi:transketolase
MDGHDFNSMRTTMQQIDQHQGNGKPKMIIMKTEMGQGVDFMMGTHKWHGSAPNDEQLSVALAQLEETQGDF